MTAPLPVEPFPYEQPPEQPSPAVEVVIATLTAYLASQAAIPAATLPASLIALLGTIGIPPIPARRAARLALSVRMTGRSRYGAPTMYPGAPTTRRVAADEPLMRARYIVNAARRLTRALIDGQLPAATRAEKRYLVAHVNAGRNRRAAAKRLDQLAERSGPWLKWNTRRDNRVTLDCRRLDGVVFTIDNPPAVPGAVHPTCRCYATAADPGDLTLRRVA